MALFDVLNDESLLNKRNEWFSKLQGIYDGTYLPQDCFYLNGVMAPFTEKIYTDPEGFVDESLAYLAERADRLFDERIFRPLTFNCAAYNVHYIDKIFGAEVFCRDDWESHYLSTPIGTLEAPDYQNDPTVQLTLRMAKRFTEEAGSVPLFGLPCIASPLNVAVNLYGQEFLVALIEDPEAARHDLEIITDLQVNLHKEFRKIVPAEQLQPVLAWRRTQPPRFGQICGCTTQLVSKETYCEFFRDLDERILGVYENGGMIHLCGSHLQHIETFREMKKLRAVQLNDRAAWDFETFFHELRPDQVIYVSPCDKMPEEKIRAISKGKRVIIPVRR